MYYIYVLWIKLLNKTLALLPFSAKLIIDLRHIDVTYVYLLMTRRFRWLFPFSLLMGVRIPEYVSYKTLWLYAMTADVRIFLSQNDFFGNGLLYLIDMSIQRYGPLAKARNDVTLSYIADVYKSTRWLYYIANKLIHVIKTPA